MSIYVLTYLDAADEEQVIELPAYSRSQALLKAELEGISEVVDCECVIANACA